MRWLLTRLICGLIFFNVILPGQAQSSAFTYQGRLDDSGQPANGTYDLKLLLLATNLQGSAIGVVTNLGVPVTNGLFTVTVDFGPGVFGATNYCLQIAVRTNQATDFITLNPPELITPAPLALYAASTGNSLIAATADSVAATNINGVLASRTLPYGVLSNLISAVAAPWTNQVTAQNIVSAGGVTQTPEIWVFTNNTYYANGAWYQASGNIIQEAINHLPVGNLFEPGGGVILLGPGTFYISSPISIHETNPFTIELRGQGQTASGIVGTMSGPVLSVGNTNGTRINFELHHLFCASTVNTFTNLIEIGDPMPVGASRNSTALNTGGVANVNIHDCYMGAWQAMTNNISIGVLQGLATPTTGVPGFIPRLVPIWVQTVYSDNYTIRNCHFFETAGLYLSCDHARIEDNDFFYLGQNTDWTNTSPFSLGSALIFGEVVNDDWFTTGNHFYGCGGGIFSSATTANGASMNDFYEFCGFTVATTPDTAWVMFNVDVVGGGARTVGMYPTYSFISVPNPAIQNISLNQGQTQIGGVTFAPTSFSMLDGNVSVSGTPYPVRFNIFSAGSTNANGTYINNGTIWTNTTGTYIDYNSADETFQIYSNQTLLYDFSDIGGNFDVSFFGNQDAGALPVPYCTIYSVLTNIAVVSYGTYYGDGSGLTNLQMSALSHDGLNTNLEVMDPNGVTHNLLFTNGILRGVQ